MSTDDTIIDINHTDPTNIAIATPVTADTTTATLAEPEYPLLDLPADVFGPEFWPYVPVFPKKQYIRIPYNSSDNFPSK